MAVFRTSFRPIFADRRAGFIGFSMFIVGFWSIFADRRAGSKDFGLQHGGFC